MMLTVDHLTVRYGDCEALTDCSFSAREGEWWMIVGPNGAGKSSLLRAVSQAVPHAGGCALCGAAMEQMKPRERAAQVAVLAQSHETPFAYTVEEVARLGRYAHRRPLRGETAEDRAAVAEALALTGLTELKNARLNQLSGGEAQRAFLAQVFAQQPRLLLLDEPANHLDIPYQRQIFDLISAWARKPGHAVVAIVHDVALARRYGTHALLLRGGRTVAKGPMEAVLTPANLQAVYGMDVAGWMREMYEGWQSALPGASGS